MEERSGLLDTVPYLLHSHSSRSSRTSLIRFKSVLSSQRAKNPPKAGNIIKNTLAMLLTILSLILKAAEEADAVPIRPPISATCLTEPLAVRE